jgi:hypothetical protein
MAEYRLLLDGGAILVVTLEIEEAAEVETDPTSIGTALLAALGIGRPTQTRPQPAPAPKHRATRRAAPVEEDPDAWLVRTSRESMKGMPE